MTTDNSHYCTGKNFTGSAQKQNSQSNFSGWFYCFSAVDRVTGRAPGLLIKRHPIVPIKDSFWGSGRNWGNSRQADQLSNNWKW